MIRTTISLAFLLVILIGMVFLQIYLSKRKNKWLGLILPGICLGYSLLIVFGYMAYAGMSTGTEIGMMAGAFVMANIPTVVLLAIYIACREKFKKNKEMEKMNIQDL